MATPSHRQSERLQHVFAQTKKEQRSALVSFVSAGDPNYQTSLDILKKLPQAGADIIELGMPFSDPMADGPAIQQSSLRALKNGQTMKHTLEMVRAFRTDNHYTPLILMGYYNPIYIYGVRDFLTEALAAGVDGLIIVDLPVEEDEELTLHAIDIGIDIIRLTTPTSDDARLDNILQHAGGFIYYVSVLGITGTKSAMNDEIASAVARLRNKSDLPIAVGFGIKTAQQIRELNNVADALVVGSAIVDCIARGITESLSDNEISDNLLNFVETLATAIKEDKS